MPFSPPTFNLIADVYNGPWNSKSLRMSIPANLAFGRRVQVLAETDFAPQTIPTSFAPLLLCPKLTDLRDQSQGFPPDIIECPSGTGRWYVLFAWEDVGKGFSNEYRAAQIIKISNAVDPAAYPGLFWPTPAP